MIIRTTFYKLLLGFLVITSGIMPVTADAGLVPCGTWDSGTKCTLCDLIVGMNEIILFLRNIMVYIAFAVIVAMAIFYIVSAGNDGMMSKAKDGIKAALVGIAIVLLAWVVVNTLMFVVFQAKSDLGVSVSFRGARGFTFSCSGAAGSTSSSSSPASSFSSSTATPSSSPSTATTTTVSPGGTFIVGAGKTLTLPSGGSFVTSFPTNITFPHGGTITNPSTGVSNTVSAGEVVTSLPLGTTVLLPAAGSATLAVGQSLTFPTGATVQGGK